MSRIIARAAYTQLIELGLVTTQERRGYYVHLIRPIVIQLGGTGKAADADLLALDEWESAAVAQGRRPHTEVQVRVLGGHDSAPPEVLERLSLGNDDLSCSATGSATSTTSRSCCAPLTSPRRSPAAPS